MPIVPIPDLDDPRLAPYRHLKATNATRWTDQFVVEGPKLLDRLARSRFPLVSALATEQAAGSLAETLPPATPLYVVARDRLTELVGFQFHQGVLGCGRRIPWDGVGRWLEWPPARLRLVVCPELHNPENLGAIIRLADVFGVDAILTGEACPDPLSRRVLRVSMGCALEVPVLALESLAAEVERLRDALGLVLAATVVDPTAEPFEAFAVPDRLALILGAEGPGLADEWVDRADRRITIPMRPGAESLNVAVAAGILLYHMTRNRT